MTAVDVEVHATIDRTRHDVAAYCCDPATVTTWNANIRAVEWDSSEPVDEGSLLRFTSGFLGRTMVYTYEVVESVPDERFVMRSVRGPFSMETTYLWQDAERGATWMTLRNRGEPTGFAGLAAPILATAVRRATAKDLHRLKLVLESR